MHINVGSHNKLQLKRHNRPKPKNNKPELKQNLILILRAKGPITKQANKNPNKLLAKNVPNRPIRAPAGLHRLNQNRPAPAAARPHIQMRLNSATRQQTDKSNKIHNKSLEENMQGYLGFEWHF